MGAKHLKIRRNKNKNKTQQNKNDMQMTCFGGQFSSITLPSWNVYMEKFYPGWEGLPDLADWATPLGVLTSPIM